MGRNRSKEPSVPTMKAWLMTYHAYMKKMVEDEKIGLEEAKIVAKGLRYAIKGLERSQKKYKSQKSQRQKESYHDSIEFFDD